MTDKASLSQPSGVAGVSSSGGAAMNERNETKQPPAHRDKSHRHLMMDEAERRLLNGLPLEFIIYRGCGPANEQGWSWTLSAEQAEWFAERLPGRNGGIVLEGECHRLDIIAFLDGGGEDEILIDPEDVRIVRRVDIRLDEDGMDDQT